MLIDGPQEERYKEAKEEPSLPEEPDRRWGFINRVEEEAGKGDDTGLTFVRPLLRGKIDRGS